MSEFLSFAWELLSKVVYNIVAVFAALLNLLVFGWVDYFNIFLSYFNTFNPVGKIGAVILFALLVAIPVLIVIILVRRWKVHRELLHDKSDNKTLYREIGRLNKQVLDLMEEKNKLLAIKVNAMGGTQRIPYMALPPLPTTSSPPLGTFLARERLRAGKAKPFPASSRVPPRFRLTAIRFPTPLRQWPRPRWRPGRLPRRRRSPWPTASPSCRSST